jgi:hypothetical protein
LILAFRPVAPRLPRNKASCHPEERSDEGSRLRYP